ncbi:MAG: hemin uptake protein HemP [Halomonas sp.]|nr:hemin uptake protein HemP [Halomonas sp.]MBP5979864.1 hemin uptake protein HemP [Halomonas sp.]
MQLAARGTDTSTTPAPREIESRELLGPKGQLVIQHENRRYVLRITKSGKLILTA